MATTLDVKEIADRSPLHAVGVAIAQQAQAHLERQRRLWQLREKRRAVAEELAKLDEEIVVEQHEQERDAKLYELSLEHFESVGLVLYEEDQERRSRQVVSRVAAYTRTPQ